MGGEGTALLPRRLPRPLDALACAAADGLPPQLAAPPGWYRPNVTAAQARASSQSTNFATCINAVRLDALSCRPCVCLVQLLWCAVCCTITFKPCTSVAWLCAAECAAPSQATSERLRRGARAPLRLRRLPCPPSGGPCQLACAQMLRLASTAPASPAQAVAQHSLMKRMSPTPAWPCPQAANSGFRPAVGQFAVVITWPSINLAGFDGEGERCSAQCTPCA